MAALSDYIDQSNLEPFHASGIVDDTQLKAIGVMGVVYESPLEAFEILFGNIDEIVLESDKA